MRTIWELFQNCYRWDDEHPVTLSITLFGLPDLAPAVDVVAKESLGANALSVIRQCRRDEESITLAANEAVDELERKIREKYGTLAVKGPADA